jgi:hypothetical protein
VAVGGGAEGTEVGAGTRASEARRRRRRRGRRRKGEDERERGFRERISRLKNRRQWRGHFVYVRQHGTPRQLARLGSKNYDGPLYTF